jgi:hypothetical protein
MTDVDYVRVHTAMSRVGVKLERERLERIERRNSAHVAAGGVICALCTRPGRRFMNLRACELHAPAPIRATECLKPLRCYCASCARHDEPAPVDRRHELQERIEAWRQHARGEIMQLASLRVPFGPRDLAALLPIKLAGSSARDWLTQLLDEGVNAGALVQLGPAQWRARRDDEAVQRVETSATPYTLPRVDTDRVERDNRYQ